MSPPPVHILRGPHHPAQHQPHTRHSTSHTQRESPQLVGVGGDQEDQSGRGRRRGDDWGGACAKTALQRRDAHQLADRLLPRDARRCRRVQLQRAHHRPVLVVVVPGVRGEEGRQAVVVERRCAAEVGSERGAVGVEAGDAAALAVERRRVQLDPRVTASVVQLLTHQVAARRRAALCAVAPAADASVRGPAAAFGAGAASNGAAVASFG
mmetsp:Transcript_27267/g.69505  ORF Transcript_27267/g.69505 Transcript_27267/m.69505 type:complete len:210 (-) Transcript_27267:224-853(-)